MRSNFIVCLLGVGGLCWSLTGLSSARTLNTGDLAQAQQNQANLGIAVPNTTGPTLQYVTQTSATLLFEDSRVQTCLVEYGLTAEYGLRVSSPPKDYLHEVTLSGLTAETEYHYRVTCGNTQSKDHVFRTAVWETSPFRFAVISDSQDNPDIFTEVAEAVRLTQPDFVLHAGDETGNGLIYELWKTEYLDPAGELMAEAPIYVSIGNHESNSPYFNYYHAYPQPEVRYTLAYGNAFFIFLDTSYGIYAGSPKLTWLEEALASSQAQEATWLFVVHHQPAYTEGWNPCDYVGDPAVRRFVVPLMESYGVDMVFNGHTHGYERGLLHGVAYVLAGGAGGSLDIFCTDWPHISLSEYVHHFVTVDIAGSSLSLTAEQVDGTVIDSFTLQK